MSLDFADLLLEVIERNASDLHLTAGAHPTVGNIGMQTMDAALATLVRAGKISQKLAEARSSTPEELRRLMGASSFAA